MNLFRKKDNGQRPGESFGTAQNRPAAFDQGRVGNGGADPAPETVRGERGAPIVNRATSIQSKTSGILAAGLMAILGLGTLTWYYSTAMSRQTQARQNAKATVTNRAQGEMELPPLGRIDPPESAERGAEAALTAQNAHPSSTTNSAGSQAPADHGDLPQLPAIYPPAYGAASTPPPTGYAPSAVKTRAELALERRLSGDAYARHSSSSTAGSTGAGVPNEVPGAGDPALSLAPGIGASGPAAGSGGTGAAREENLATLLRPALTPAVPAKILPTQRLLLAKGAFIDCTLETAIDSTLPGMTTCITATDTFGVDGKVVLLERGTKLVGETRGQAQQGSARVFVLWTEARTPTGVVVPLDSPGTDELGRSGLSGKVNRHFWERFGAAILISLIDGGVQAASRSSGGGGGTVIYSPSTSQDVMTEVLKGTINIAPTVTKHQGDRIQVLVARDLDFRPVYELNSTTSAR
jgi:type IV secretion system protein VirB10